MKQERKSVVLALLSLVSLAHVIQTVQEQVDLGARKVEVARELDGVRGAVSRIMVSGQCSV